MEVLCSGYIVSFHHPLTCVCRNHKSSLPTARACQGSGTSQVSCHPDHALPTRGSLSCVFGVSRVYGHPLIDLRTTWVNAKLPSYVSPILHPVV